MAENFIVVRRQCLQPFVLSWALSFTMTWKQTSLVLLTTGQTKTFAGNASQFSCPGIIRFFSSVKVFSSTFLAFSLFLPLLLYAVTIPQPSLSGRAFIFYAETRSEDEIGPKKQGEREGEKEDIRKSCLRRDFLERIPSSRELRVEIPH